jgi:UbiD family decarboxylase
LVPGVTEDEGPFCEFHNYYTAGVAAKPALDVKAITMRGDALFRHVNATPYTDHQRLVAIPAEARLYDQLKRKGIDVRDVFMPPWGGLFLVIIKLVPKIDEEVREALLTALYSPVLLFSKVVMAVDEDVDVYDSRDIIYSLAVRVNPSADVLTLDGTIGLPYDLSLPEMPGAAPLRVGSKLGINATKPPLAKKDLRAKMERMSPKGWGRVSLKDFT